MPWYAVLLRAVNLGGDTTLGMASLRAALERAGFGGVNTYLQSGNVVLDAKDPQSADVERRIEQVLDRTFGLRTDAMARTAGEWRAVVRNNPFADAARADPSHLTVLSLKAPVPASAWTALENVISGREESRGSGRQGYVYYPDGIGRSRLTLDLIERALGGHGTLRNWNTVLKLDAALRR